MIEPALKSGKIRKNILDNKNMIYKSFNINTLNQYFIDCY